MSRRVTLVALHAHPDDESLLTGGTLARCSAEGHRVILVTATLGQAGGPGERRREELHAAAYALGCARVVELGYHDSGLCNDAITPDGAPPRFSDVPIDRAAARLAGILGEERADVLIGYDARGGYGHPDHVQAHRVARRAAAIAGTPVLLEVTVDRRRLRLLLALMRFAGRLVPSLPLAGVAHAFTPREQITHVVDVRKYLKHKRAALRAHATQSHNGRRIGTVGLLGRLPLPILRLVAGREWYVQAGEATVREEPSDVFTTVP